MYVNIYIYINKYIYIYIQRSEAKASLTENHNIYYYHLLPVVGCALLPFDVNLSLSPCFLAKSAPQWCSSQNSSTPKGAQIAKFHSEVAVSQNDQTNQTKKTKKTNSSPLKKCCLENELLSFWQDLYFQGLLPPPTQRLKDGIQGTSQFQEIQIFVRESDSFRRVGALWGACFAEENVSFFFRIPWHCFRVNGASLPFLQQIWIILCSSYVHPMNPMLSWILNSRCSSYVHCLWFFLVGHSLVFNHPPSSSPKKNS